MSIPGYATPSGTEQFARKFKSQYAEHAYHPLGKINLMVSRLGFGTYRCHHGIKSHHEALLLALERGCNIIDTSANYTDGNAEVLIGDIFNQQIVWGNLEREQVVVVSKTGYIQGENMEVALERERNSNPFPEVVKYQPELWHCMHPDFIEDQITRSLARMHLDTLDIYLLHNPEYFLNHAHRDGTPVREDTEKEFYDRIRRAFFRMEKLVDEGLFRYYGISSNGFPLAEKSFEHVSLARIWKAYEDACLQRGLSTKAGHFAVIQLPFNWLEHSAVTLKNNLFQKQHYSVLELSKHLHLGVLVNRPLNAIYNNRLLRLAEPPSDDMADHRKSFKDDLLALSGYQNYHPVVHLAERFETLYPGLAKKLTFSQKALLLAAYTPGVDVVLNGMRQPQYVDDSMKIMSIEASISIRKLFE